MVQELNPRSDKFAPAVRLFPRHDHEVSRSEVIAPLNKRLEILGA